jgi:hypothetical protein
MAKYDFGENEIFFMLAALESYAQKRWDESGEDLEDAGNDILMIKGIIRHIKEGKLPD